MFGYTVHNGIIEFDFEEMEEFKKWVDTYYWGELVRIIEKNARGYIEVEFSKNYPTRGYICGISVDPSERLKGIGTALAREAEAVIKSRGLKYAYLYVDKDKEQNRVFWEKNGYKYLEYLDDKESKYYYYLKEL